MNNINIKNKHNLALSGVFAISAWCGAKKKKKDLKNKHVYNILTILGTVISAYFINKVVEDNFTPIEETE